MKKLGIATWFGYVAPFEERLKAIKTAGFSAVFTLWSPDMEGFDGPLLEQPEKIDKAGLILENAHLPYYHTNDFWEDNLNGEAYYDRIIQGVQTAAQAGVKTLVIHPVDRTVPDQALYPIFYDRMRRVSDLCAKHEIRLAVENLGEKIVIGKIIRDLWDNPFVGLCFDSGHNNVENGADLHLLADFKERVFAVHLHDNNGRKDQHLLPGSPGCTVDWQAVNAALAQTNFTGSMMTEACYPVDYDKMEEMADMAYSNPELPMAEWLRYAAMMCRKAFEM